MTEKLDIAKLATELTIAALQDKSGAAGKVVHAGRIKNTDKDTPDLLVMFDAIYDHLSAKLTPH